MHVSKRRQFQRSRLPYQPVLDLIRLDAIHAFHWWPGCLARLGYYLCFETKDSRDEGECQVVICQPRQNLGYGANLSKKCGAERGGANPGKKRNKEPGENPGLTGLSIQLSVSCSWDSWLDATPGLSYSNLYTRLSGFSSRRDELDKESLDGASANRMTRVNHYICPLSDDREMTRGKR
jgi:hypothetical protein